MVCIELDVFAASDMLVAVVVVAVSCTCGFPKSRCPVIALLEVGNNETFWLITLDCGNFNLRCMFSCLHSSQSKEYSNILAMSSNSLTDHLHSLFSSFCAKMRSIKIGLPISAMGVLGSGVLDVCSISLVFLRSCLRRVVFPALGVP